MGCRKDFPNQWLSLSLGFVAWLSIWKTNLKEVIVVPAPLLYRDLLMTVVSWLA